MANQNLSQFGENTSVSNADYTFVWDSANSISKKVSRNSWLNSGTLTSDAPVTISQTWNNAAVAFTGVKFNAAGTSDANSAAGSLLADFQLNGVTKFSVTKAGRTKVGNIIDIGASVLSYEAPYLRTYSPFSCTALDIGAAGSLLLVFDAANTLALRNGAAAQTFNVYGTSSASNANYARLALTCGLDGNATISTQALGTGTAGTVSINGVPVGLGKGNLSTNVAIGTNSLSSNTSGDFNSSVGYGALSANTGGLWNSAFGASVLTNNTGSYNSSFGVLSLFSNVGGSYNSAFGLSAGRFIAGGATANAVTNNSIYIGALTKANASGETNQIVIGYDATGIGSNSVVLGNDSITKTALKGNVGIGTTAPVAKLNVAGGDLYGTFTNASIALSYSTTNQYSHYIHTRHSAGISVGNAIDFYTSAGGASGVYPSNVVHGLSIDDGKVGIGTTSPTSKLHVAGNGLFTGNVEVGTTSYVYWGNRCLLSSPIDGIILLQNQNASDFNRLSFGFNNLNAPALKRVGTELQVVQAGTTAASNFAAGDADLTFIEDRYRRKGAGTPEGVVTAPIGAVYHNTTGGAGTSFYVKESGTGNTGWVGK